MAVSMPLAKHGFLLGKREEELYEIVDAAMSIAAWRNPKEFLCRRDQIAKNLFSLPEDVIGSCYQKSHCTMESKTGSDVTEESVSENLKFVADDSTKKGSKVKIRLKPYRFTATNSKKDDKNSSKYVAAKINEHKKKIDDQNLGVSEFVAANVKKDVSNNGGLLDQKFEASKRKLEQRYRQLGEGQRKTKVIDFREIKDLPKTTRDVKRPRFRR